MDTGSAVSRATAPGRVLGGRYVVLGELGRGGMGVVWRAEDQLIGRQVAVKELHLPGGLTPEEHQLLRARLLREARSAGRLNDPGIVTVYDVVTENGVDHIVMELIEARTLADTVATDGALPADRAVTVAEQLLSALRTAHEAGVTHRDVKPANVMLAADGRVTLTDFGIAVATDDTRLTSSGLLGSPAYLAPEQLDGAEVSPAADLWALGATLFYAVEGRAAFGRDTTAATIYAVSQAEVPATRIGGPLGPVIAGLLQREPAARLTGAQAVALLRSVPTAAVPTTGPGAAEPITTVVTAPSARGSGAHREGAGAARRRWWPWLVVGLVLGVVAGVVGTSLVSGVGDRAVAPLYYGQDGDVAAFRVSEGRCLVSAPAPGRGITDDSAFGDCATPHAAQVYKALVAFREDVPNVYPGRPGLEDFGRAACLLQFDTIVVGADKPDLVLTAVLPTETVYQAQRRSETGAVSYPDRDVFCVLSAPAGQQIVGNRMVAR